MGNDTATLRALCGELNNPILTGAVVEPDSSPPSKDTAAALDQSFTQAAEAQAAIMAATGASPVERRAVVQTIPTAPKPYDAGAPFKMSRPSRLFFTGAPRSGKSWLAAQLGARTMELDDPIRAMTASAFGDCKNDDYVVFANQVFAWGEGIVSSKFPLTAPRMHFVEYMRETPNLERFGTADFWVTRLIARVTAFQKDFPGEMVVVTDVGSVSQYRALREAGFLAFHVQCNNVTRSGRGGNAVVPSLVTGIEQDITKKISQQPRGPKLWCVWNDPHYAAPSSRFISIEEFLKGVSK